MEWLQPPVVVLLRGGVFHWQPYWRVSNDCIDVLRKTSQPITTAPPCDCGRNVVVMTYLFPCILCFGAQGLAAALCSAVVRA